MATITMRSGFTLVPEGTHIFRIYKVDYNEEFGRLIAHMVNAQGITYQERFSLLNSDNSPNERACNAFSYFAKTALNNFALEEIDHNDLVGHYIKLEIIHNTIPSNNDPSKTVTFANSKDKWSAEGFDTTPVPKALTLGTEAPQPTVTTAPAPSEVNLDEILD
jgi:hypothetical protein